MPNAAIFTCKPIGQFVRRYLDESTVSIDPFAGDFTGATWRNDIRHFTEADYHMTAEAFLTDLLHDGITADLIIFDPPYSKEQAKRSYQLAGMDWCYSDTLQVGYWSNEKTLCAGLLTPSGIFLHFGWHTNGLGKKRGFEIAEILIVAHGGAHHDTICMAECRTTDGM